MDLNFDLEDRYKAGLRKWDKYGPGFIPAWVAEHDFGCPPAVHERLSHVLSLGALVITMKIENSESHLPSGLTVEILGNSIQSE